MATSETPPQVQRVHAPQPPAHFVLYMGPEIQNVRSVVKAAAGPLDQI